MSELTPNPIVLDRSGIDIVAHLNDAEREAAGDLAKTLEASLRAVVAELEPRVLAVRGNQDLSASGKRSRAVALAQEARKEVRAALTTATEGTSRAKKASEAKIPTSPAELKPDTKPEVLTWRELRAHPRSPRRSRPTRARPGGRRGLAGFSRGAGARMASCRRQRTRPDQGT